MVEETIKKLAFIIDEAVVDILHTDARLAAILLSDPLAIDVSYWYNESSNANKVLNNAYYNSTNQKFKLNSPGPGYIFNETTYEWEFTRPSTPMPVEEGKFFVWDYENNKWDSYNVEDYDTEGTVSPAPIFTPESETIPPVKVAYVIDNLVVDVVYTDERLGSIFLSEPIIIDITNNDDVSIGSAYDSETGSFLNIS